MSPIARSSDDPPNWSAQTKVPLASSLTTNASVPPAEVKGAIAAPGSRSAVPENHPDTVIPFAVSTPTDRASSSLVPPNVRAHINVPDELNLVTKPSNPPAAVTLATPTPGSKSTVPLNKPATMRLVLASTCTDEPALSPVPARVSAQTNAPLVSSLTMNVLKLVDESVVTPAVGSKSHVPPKSPTTYTFPLASRATE